MNFTVRIPKVLKFSNLLRFNVNNFYTCLYVAYKAEKTDLANLRTFINHFDRGLPMERAIITFSNFKVKVFLHKFQAGHGLTFLLLSKYDFF